MESEEHEFAAAIGAPVSEKCNEVLLPTDSVSTNGISNLSAINFLEEATGEDCVEELDGNDKEEELEDELDEEDGVETADIENEEGVEEEYDEEAENATPQKECAQLPKKRKFAPSGAYEDDDDDDDDDDDEEEQNETVKDTVVNAKINAKKVLTNAVAHTADDELPTSSARAAANKENTVDEDTCRVCTTKENLVSLFKRMEDKTVADLLMLICSSVSIARKDFMPQYVCQSCLNNITIAVQLKAQCESTERELRKKLSRHKNKVRRPSGYVVIDAPVESDPDDDDEEPADDVEFKVSDEEVSPSADESDTDDSDFGGSSSKKKRMTRGGAASKRGRRKSIAATITAKEKKPKGRPPKRSALSSGEEEFITEKKKKDPISADNSSNDFPCDECEQVFTRKLSLVLHKKTHTQSEPIICNLCGKHFKIKGAYRTHMERHKTEATTFPCSKCSLMFNSKSELKLHHMEGHSQLVKDGELMCKHCKRFFVSDARLQRHLENFCPSSELAQKQRKSEYTEMPATGKDLFKTVAPLTTTYWSDSFSD